MPIFNSSTAFCPKCENVFDLPTRLHPIKVRIACPYCRAPLEVLLGTRGQQKAKLAKYPIRSSPRR